ncbi:MAG: DUF4834 family protein [Bacteroidia bacterium]|nr:DUF4834 family protein [Bacteroidia bacterium]
MLRIILVFVLIGYLLYKFGFFRALTGDDSPNKPRGGNVNVDSNPQEKKRSDFKGGEYVDYEDVKD